MVLMPIPMFIVGLIALFGREGKDGEDRPIKKPGLRWIYRVGGIVVLALTMKLAGVILSDLSFAIYLLEMQTLL